MCYARPETESERISVLVRLRDKAIIFPHNFNHIAFYKEVDIIR